MISRDRHGARLPFARAAIPLAVVLALAACGAAARSNMVEAMRWVESADSAATYRRDVETGRLRFFGVYGYAFQIPSVGTIASSVCYPGVEVTPIEGTSDGTVGSEHMRLDRIARAFARDYNALMKAHLDATGGRSCAPGVDWEGAFDDVAAITGYDSEIEGNTGLTMDIPPDVNVELKDVGAARDVSRQVCAALARNGIAADTGIEIMEWMPEPGVRVRPYGRAACADGELISTTF